MFIAACFTGHITLSQPLDIHKTLIKVVKFFALSCVNKITIVYFKQSGGFTVHEPIEYISHVKSHSAESEKKQKACGQLLMTFTVYDLIFLQVAGTK